MPKDAWMSLSKEAQAKWDEFSQEEKAKILSARKATDQKSNGRRSRNTHQVMNQESGIHDHDGDEDASTPGDLEDATDLEVNETTMTEAAINEKKGSTHPGDLRRVLGGPKEDSKVKFKVRTHSLKISKNEESQDPYDALEQGNYESDSSSDSSHGQYDRFIDEHWGDESQYFH